MCGRAVFVYHGSFVHTIGCILLETGVLTASYFQAAAVDNHEFLYTMSNCPFDATVNFNSFE